MKLQWTVVFVKIVFEALEYSHNSIYIGPILDVYTNHMLILYIVFASEEKDKIFINHHGWTDKNKQMNKKIIV